MATCNICNKSCSRYRVINGKDICQDCLGFDIVINSKHKGMISTREYFAEVENSERNQKQAHAEWERKDSEKFKTILGQVYSEKRTV